MAYADPEKEKEYKKVWYEANKVHHLKNCRKRTVAYRKHLMEIVEGLKTMCSLCPEKDSCCLEFHHIDPSQKDLEISIAVRNSWSEKRLMKEVAKCLVVCRNCHAKIHKHGIPLTGDDK